MSFALAAPTKNNTPRLPEKPDARPVHQRSLRHRKPAAIIIKDVSSSEDRDQRRFRNMEGQLETNLRHSLGLPEATIQKTRKRKANDDNHGVSESPKSVCPPSQRPTRKAKKTNSAVSKPGDRKHSYSLCSGDGKRPV
ncbi:hypothetical protein Bca52824_065182 [Brassica carinata]|uniref:Uncharacterized protein n=1 Tax=Brassica carinata TaxID=52824 RepID=A0A8X7QJV2_BRACI|nr:hypothetical protein Bca52824_065182 [Brassica carinata]